MRYLRSRSSVSTLTVAIHEAYPIVAEHAGSHPMRDAFAQAGRNLHWCHGRHDRVSRRAHPDRRDCSVQCCSSDDASSRRMDFGYRKRPALIAPNTARHARLRSRHSHVHFVNSR